MCAKVSCPVVACLQCAGLVFLKAAHDTGYLWLQTLVVAIVARSCRNLDECVLPNTLEEQVLEHVNAPHYMIDRIDNQIKSLQAQEQLNKEAPAKHGRRKHT